MILTGEAPLVMRALQGLVCIYKPTGHSVERLRETFLAKLSTELNTLNVRPPAPMVEILGDTNAPMKVDVVENLADHPLVVGPRYQVKDFKTSFATHLGHSSSGVFLFGLGSGTKFTYSLRMSRPVRVYQVHGQFGLATDSYFANGKVVEKAQFKHVTRAKIDGIVAYIQAAHQRKMYEICGVSMESQAAYEMACKGLIRPAENKMPVIYGMKCIHYEKPNFIIEIQSINEYDKYLHTFIHDVGIQLKTVSYCTKVIRIREGMFTLDNALLMKHWTLQNVIDNIKTNKKLLRSQGNVWDQSVELRPEPEVDESDELLLDRPKFMIESS